MKHAFLACLLLITTLSLFAQEQPKTQALPDAPKINPEKESDIRKLLQISGAGNLGKQIMDNMATNIKPLLKNSLPPGTYRDQLIALFFQKFQSKADANVLVELAIPAYDRYLSDEEIKGLIQFYSTPLGQKAVSVMPKLADEARQRGEEWGQKMGRQTMQEVLAEHPDLAKQLEAAAAQQVLPK